MSTRLQRGWPERNRSGRSLYRERTRSGDHGVIDQRVAPTQAATAKRVPGAAVSTGSRFASRPVRCSPHGRRGGGEGFTRGFYQLARAAFACGCESLCFADGAAESQGLDALGGAEVAVAGAEGQAVGLANDGTDDDFDGKAQSATMRRRTATWAASFWPK